MPSVLSCRSFKEAVICGRMDVSASKLSARLDWASSLARVDVLLQYQLLALCREEHVTGSWHWSLRHIVCQVKLDPLQHGLPHFVPTLGPSPQARRDLAPGKVSSSRRESTWLARPCFPKPRQSLDVLRKIHKCHPHSRPAQLLALLPQWMGPKDLLMQLLVATSANLCKQRQLR